MPSGAFVAYYRVSTARQGSSGLGLEAQQRAVRDYLNGGNWQLCAEYTEVESGKRNSRPKLAEALAAAKRYKAKLIIAKLDRLARNVAFIANLMESKVEFEAVDMPDANPLTIHIISAVAQHERELISQRTKAALAEAKARGRRLGNPTNLEEARKRAAEVRRSTARQSASNALVLIQKLQSIGIETLREIAEQLNERHYPAPRGGQWQATQVRRVLERFR